MKIWAQLIALVVVLAYTSIASAALHTFPLVLMSAAQEVQAPPVVSPGSGFATVTFDDVTKILSVSGGYGGLTGDVTAAHVHGLAPAGVNAGVIFGLTTTGGTTGTIDGSGALSAGNEIGLFANQTYIKLAGTTVLHTVTLMAVTGVLGYCIAYFLVMKVRSPGWRLALFMAFIIPFWTSTLIRAIAWVPFLGVNGVINQLMQMCITHKLPEWLGKMATRLSEIPKDRPVVLYCASGVRSGSAAKLLRHAGYADVTNAGGLGDMPR